MPEDPFAPPASDVGGTSSKPEPDLGPVRFDVPTPKGFGWSVAFHDQHVRLTEIDGPKTFTFTRDELPTKASLVFMPGGGIGLTLSTDKKLVVNIPKAQLPMFRRWVEPIVGEMIRAPFVRGRATRLIMTVLGLAALLFDPDLFWMALVVWSGAGIAASYLPPRPYLYLAQGLFSLGLSGYFAYVVLMGSGPKWFVVFLVFILFGAFGSLKRFRFFRLSPTGPATARAV